MTRIPEKLLKKMGDAGLWFYKIRILDVKGKEVTTFNILPYSIFKIDKRYYKYEILKYYRNIEEIKGAVYR